MYMSQKGMANSKSHGKIQPLHSEPESHDASKKPVNKTMDKEMLYNMVPSKARTEMMVKLWEKSKAEGEHDEHVKQDAEKKFQQISKQKKGTRFYLKKSERENILEKLDDIWRLKAKQEKYFTRH